MDRFIEYTYYCINELENGLKSNMDRFIVICSSTNEIGISSLKSNMDRFIARPPQALFSKVLKFKIQYG